MAKTKFGTIVIPPGVFPEKHEKRTVDTLALRLRLNITFLIPSRKENDSTPDIDMDGCLWEIKCPLGKSSRTIENNLRQALQQSPNIVLDLRRLDVRIPTHKYLHEVKKQFTFAKSIRRMIVITREDRIIDLKR